MIKYRIVSSDYLHPHDKLPLFMVEQALHYKEEVIGFIPKIRVDSMEKAEEYVEYYMNTKPIIYKEYE